MVVSKLKSKFAILGSQCAPCITYNWPICTCTSPPTCSHVNGKMYQSGHILAVSICIIAVFFITQAIDDPSSNQFRDPPTYTHQPSMQQKVPFSLIRCSSSKVAFCSCVEWGWHIYNIVESESDPLTRRAVDLFEKEPLKGNSEVHLHTPTKFGEDRSKDLGGDREQTDRQTNRQTDKRCSIYSMIAHTVYINDYLLRYTHMTLWLVC